MNQIEVNIDRKQNMVLIRQNKTPLLSLLFKRTSPDEQGEVIGEIYPEKNGKPDVEQFVAWSKNDELGCFQLEDILSEDRILWFVNEFTKQNVEISEWNEVDWHPKKGK